MFEIIIEKHQHWGAIGWLGAATRHIPGTVCPLPTHLSGSSMSPA